MKTKSFIVVILCALCVSLFPGCETGGSFNASYTDPKTGATWHGGVDLPRPTTRDNKSTVNDGP